MKNGEFQMNFKGNLGSLLFLTVGPYSYVYGGRRKISCISLYLHIIYQHKQPKWPSKRLFSSVGNAPQVGKKMS
jgi:hypothetical protein